MSRKKTKNAEIFAEKLERNRMFPLQGVSNKTSKSKIKEQIKEESIDEDIKDTLLITRFNFTEPLSDTEAESVIRSLKRLEKKWNGSKLSITKVPLSEKDEYDFSVGFEPCEDEIKYETWGRTVQEDSKPCLLFVSNIPHEEYWKNDPEIKYWETLKIYTYKGYRLYKSKAEAASSVSV